jgi:hypothetical protein
MAAIRKSITVALLSLGLLALSCSGGNDKWFGTWEGTMHRADPSTPDDDVKRTVNYLKITILPDGTFHMLESGLNKSGTHNLGSDKAFLTVKRVLDRPIQSGTGTDRENQDLVLEWQEDGSVLWHDPRGFDDDPVRLSLKTQRGS